jgi:hypothetical protein
MKIQLPLLYQIVNLRYNRAPAARQTDTMPPSTGSQDGCRYTLKPTLKTYRGSARMVATGWFARKGEVFTLPLGCASW